MILKLCAGLVTPTFCPGKLREVGLRVMVPVDWPMPVSPTDCGEPVALSVTTTVDVRVPVAVGVNVTLTIQEAATAKLVGHGFAEIAKSPDVVMELIVTG